MPQPLESTPSPEAGESEMENPAGETTTGEATERATNPVERSRFSQWLASFGLGEVPMPLLTRRRAHRG
jgi:hypothetical protein